MYVCMYACMYVCMCEHVCLSIHLRFYMCICAWLTMRLSDHVYRYLLYLFCSGAYLLTFTSTPTFSFTSTVTFTSTSTSTSSLHHLYHTYTPSSTSIPKHFSLQYLYPSNALASIGSLLIRKVYSSDDTNMPLLYLRKAVSLNSVEGEWELAQVRHHSFIIYYLFFYLTTVK